MPTSRYSAVAIALHWIIAILVVSLIPVGWWMTDAVVDPATRTQAGEVFQIHKSVGLTVLILSVLRLVWRLSHRHPPLPAEMAAWEKLAATTTHWLFYVLIIGIPLMGWAYVSTGYSVAFQRFFPFPTHFFGLFRWPDIPFIAEQAPEARKAIAEGTMFAHSKMAWGVIVLLVLHVGAALKHHIVDRDDVLTRMLPFLKPLKGQ